MMRILFLLSTCCLGIMAFRLPEPAGTVNLLQAIEQNQVSVDIHGNAKSTHYYNPIEMSVANNTAKAVSVRISTGDFFVPDDSTEQTLLITEEGLLTLQPKEKKIITVKAMCTEPSDGAGNAQSTYTLRSNTNKQLKDIAEFIQSKNYHTACAQNAVWNIVEKKPIRSIYGADSIEEKNLRQFVSNLTGRPMPTLQEINSYETNYHTRPDPTESIGGFFEFDMAKPRDVQIAMFNSQGVLVRELYNKKQVAPGPHKFNFEFDSSVYTEDEYHFKLIVDNEVRINRKWNVKAIRDQFQKQIEENRD